MIVKALKKNADDRHDTAKELWKEIEAVCVGRRVKKVAEEEETDEPKEEWIPFSGAAAPTAPAPAATSKEKRKSSEWSMVSPEEEAARRLDPNWRENSQPTKAVRREKEIPGWIESLKGSSLSCSYIFVCRISN